MKECRTMTTANIQGGRRKRRHTRSYRSYRIKYGLDVPEHLAYARRLSEVGLFIDTNMVVYPVGSSIIMDIDVGGTIYRATGLVRDSLKVDSRFARLSKTGMGIEFTEATAELKQAIASG
jgi:hypothetical protein